MNMKFVQLSTYFSDKNSTEAIVYKAPGQALFRVVAICSNRTRVIQDFNSLDLLGLNPQVEHLTLMGESFTIMNEQERLDYMREFLK